MAKKMKKEDRKSDDKMMRRDDMPRIMNEMMGKMFSAMTVEDRQSRVELEPSSS